jgi:two-component system CheB/CheR fusion protein
MAGHHVDVARDGPSGLARARELSPDVVLCDVGLPQMDGYTVARALRAEPGTRDAYLVALTGYGLPEDQRRAADAGFDAHLTKPASIAQVQDLIARAPRRHPDLHGPGPLAEP